MFLYAGLLQTSKVRRVTRQKFPLNAMRVSRAVSLVYTATNAHEVRPDRNQWLALVEKQTSMFSQW